MSLFLWKMGRWLDRGWWAYLFQDLGDLTRASLEVVAGPFYFYRQFPWPRLLGEESLLERVVCRAKGHPKGEVYFSVYGDEPDHHCRTCGEDLG